MEKTMKQEVEELKQEIARLQAVIAEPQIHIKLTQLTQQTMKKSRRIFNERIYRRA